MIDSIIILSGFGWLIYRFCVTQNLNVLYGAIFLICLQLAYWPFYLEKAIIFALIGGVATAMSGYLTQLVPYFPLIAK